MKVLSLLIVVIFLQGCFSTPENNASFDRNVQLSDLAGMYLNEGETGSSKRYLSYKIWPENYSLDVNLIKYIKVQNVNNHSVEVLALDEQKNILKSDTFVNGKDFEFDNGTISFSQGDLFSDGPGDLVVGPRGNFEELGIDTKGNGKSKKFFGMAGLVLSLFPIAGFEIEEVRFIKIE